MKKEKLKKLIIPMVLGVATFSATAVYSESSKTIKIQYGSESWNASVGPSQNLYTSAKLNEKLEFSINLTDYTTEANADINSILNVTAKVINPSKTGVIGAEKITLEETTPGVFKCSITLPENSDGKLDITIDILDGNSAGIASEKDIKFNITRDVTNPVLNVEGVEDKTYEGKVDIKATAKDNNPTVIKVKTTKNGIVQGEEVLGQEGTKSFDAEGNYQVTLVATDAAGNKSEVTKNFAINKVAPTIFIGQGENEFTQEVEHIKDPIVKVKLADENGIDYATSNIKIGAVNGIKFDSDQKNIDLTSSENIEETITVTANDTKGKTTVLTKKVKYDSQKPTLEINSGGNALLDKYGKAIDIDIVSEEDNFDKFEVRLNGEIVDVETTSNGIKHTGRISLTEDKTYDLKVIAIDKAGNKSKLISKSVTIDTKAPVISMQGVENNGYINIAASNAVIFKIKENNIKDIVISAKKYNSLDDNVGEVYAITDKVVSSGDLHSITHNFAEDGKYEIQVEAKDILDRPATKSFTFIVDKTLPTNIIKSNAKHGKIYAEDIIASVEKSDTWGLSEESSFGKTKIAHYSCDEHKEKNKNANNINISGNGAYVLKSVVTDKAGNDSKEELAFIVDKCAPDLDITTGDEKIDGQVLNSTKITGTIMESNLRDSSFIIRNENGVELTPAIKNITNDKNIYEQNIEVEGIYTVELKASDDFKEGTKYRSSQLSKTFTIDNTAPFMEIKGVEDGAIYNKNKSLELKYFDLNLESANIKIYNNGDEIVNENLEAKQTMDNLYGYDFVVDGTYKIITTVKDKAGNQVNSEINFILDKAAPVINVDKVQVFNKSISEIKGNIVEGNLEILEIKANKYNESGAIVEENKVIDHHLIKNTNNNFKVNDKYFVDGGFFTDNGKYKVFFVAKDKGGNISNESIEFVIDNKAPVTTIVGVGNLEEHNHFKNVALKINSKDFNHNKNNISVTKDGQKYDVGNFELTGTDAILNHTFNKDGDYIVKVESIDKAQNKFVDEFSFTIDTTKADISILNSDVLNGKYLNKTPIVEVKVNEKNWNHKDFNVNVNYAKTLPDGSVKKEDLPFKMSSESSKVSFNKFVEEGIYELEVAAKDAAGNNADSKNIKFVVDKIAPVINIAGVENEKEYNVNKLVTIDVKDNNHEINSIEVTRNGSKYSMGSISENGKNRNLSHNFSDEGLYSIIVKSTDKAGNTSTDQRTFTIDKTAPVINHNIGGGNGSFKDGSFINKVVAPSFSLDNKDDKIESIKINGVSYKQGSMPILSEEIEYNCEILASDKAGNKSELNLNFSIDTTMPKVEIGGLTSGFFNKDFKPTYIIEDKNLDNSRSSATLNGKEFKSGTAITTDDYYTFKAVGTDLANNMVEKNVSFVLDRGKPKIIFEESLSGKYFTEDFVPSFIIEDLTDYQIIAMLLNGEDYVLGDEVTKEGKNVFFIEVKDKAGNIENLTVEFILDKTLPKFIINGFEDKKEYNGPIEATIKLDNPNDILKTVFVNGKPAKGEMKEVDGEQIMTLQFTGIDEYKVELVAEDKAGNKTEEEHNFEIVSKQLLAKKENSMGLIMAGIGIGGALLLLAIHMKKKKISEK